MGRAWHFLRRWPVVPLFIMGVLILAALFAPVIAPADPIKSSLRDNLAPPVWYPDGTNQYLLGADDIGRDLLSRVIFGARISVVVASVSLISGMTLGIGLGLISGYYGGLIDEVIMRIVDVWIAMPFILFALVIVTVFGQNLLIMIGLLAALAWSGFVRNIRAEVLQLRESGYVAYSRVSGASDLRILARHVFPGVTSTAVVIATIRVGSLILAEASLSFLGAGVPDPTPSWGVMVANGREFIATAWWVAFFPGLAIFLVVMSLNFLGDWARDRLDPRLSQVD
ncbi:MAG: ABC transporter permease [Chloroflexota bacterium]